ncbi:hypothetical protein CEXT_654611 [Caerostris extrusa]|uniref:Secreted protein n=1 Tax=Caerostris extrusa TaxID=172846 RepID=A0AAV4PLC0_CAEEX|nr:hypothetical protein CEXT_654611 [Caerostris extrusa]
MGWPAICFQYFIMCLAGVHLTKSMSKDSDCRQCRETTRGPFPFPFGRLELLQKQGDGGHCFLFLTSTVSPSPAKEAFTARVSPFMSRGTTTSGSGHENR